MEGSVLITGATGFIGTSLCRQLRNRGERIIAVGRQQVEGPWHEFQCQDFSNQEFHIDFSDVHTIFHLVGKAHALAETKQDEGQYFAINREGTRKLLEAAKLAGVRRFVLFSSVKAMGEGGFECIDESSVCRPETPYGASKLAAEKLVLEGSYVPEPVVLRLSMVYGNTRKGNLPRMIEAVDKGRFPPLPEVGNRRSMVHVDDVVRAAILAAEKPEAVGQSYIVTDGTPYSTRQVYEWICETLGKSAPGWVIPLPLLKSLARLGDGIGRMRGRRFMFDSDALDKLTGSACYSSAKLEGELGFRAEKHLRESLPDMVRFLWSENQ